MSALILLLDDDSSFLRTVSNFLCGRGYECLETQTAFEAAAAVRTRNISCAVVDLFLDGDRGDSLSNEFVRDFLDAIPYVRLTSAPQLVPPEFSGHAVLHKRRFLDNPARLEELIIEMLAAARP